MPASTYIGRFAPSPTGPLHAGSLVTALASYLDARAHQGQWRLRIEDVDAARTLPGAADSIMQTLHACGMHWEGEVSWQSRHQARYQAAFDRLAPHVFACGCSRREISDSHHSQGGESVGVYGGACRNGLAAGKTARAYRLRVPAAGELDACIRFEDPLVGPVRQHLATAAGDFILKRADGFWAYQLAVVVDDAAEGVTHVVRGYDLLDSTARQIYLQHLLGVATPVYLHVPLVQDGCGEKLSKQNGAAPVDATRPLSALLEAARFLTLDVEKAESLEAFWRRALPCWASRFGPATR